MWTQRWEWKLHFEQCLCWSCWFAATDSWSEGRTVREKLHYLSNTSKMQQTHFILHATQWSKKEDKRRIDEHWSICMSRGRLSPPSAFPPNSPQPLTYTPLPQAHTHSLMMPLMAMFRKGMSTEKVISWCVFLHWLQRNMYFTEYFHLMLLYTFDSRHFRGKY